MMLVNSCASAETLKGHGPQVEGTWPGNVVAISPLMDYGVSADDINHDGYKEIIASGASEVGAVIFVYDHTGKLLWKKDFPEITR